MATAAASKFMFLFLSIVIMCSFGLIHSPVKESDQTQFKQGHEQTHHHSSRRELSIKTFRHDLITDPSSTTTLPTAPVTNPTTTPVTNPVTTPSATPDISTPGIITIPSANPGPVTPNPGGGGLPLVPPANPIPNPTVPITNPGNTVPAAGGQQPPPTNPVTNPTGGGGVAPPATGTSAPAVPGQSWCVAKSGASETAIQAALDYACGIGGADCSAIQVGASCYNPNSLQNHASYAFNSYYQKNPVQTSCDFGGAAAVTNANPSSGSCTYPTWSATGSPALGSPMTTNPASTPTTASSTGATPAAGSSGIPPVLNASNPAMGGATTTGGFGESPPIADAPTISMSSGLQPFICIIVTVTSVITGWILLDV